ncbi:TPA: TIGR01212 family radical SAM protein [Candidatus Gastranaerophilales bacterium HUM_9]|nr:MAG TPA: TIGR01212 family radical SAM protein [Candidatus Gastranaerophilales bacterium HUM_9]HBX34820.1 TIGR01212 family radical SAM protein [Cyanobacteria bacterium UBA11440]
MEFNGTDKRYNQFSAYLKNKYGAKVYKITIDAGFSCPNRDGHISTGGCIFCDEGGSFSQAHSNRLSVEEQVIVGAQTLATRFKAQKFMSYFQAYSNTYKPVNELEKIYSSSLKHKDVVGLSIGTRPDCIDEDKLKLISSYKDDYYTWIEYGLQTIHDKTLKKINRGHDFDTFLRAYEKTKEYGINVCVHVIFGMWETHDEMMQTAQKLAELDVDGVKIHMLVALEGTKLANMYKNNEIDFMSEEDYINTVCDFLEYLPQSTTIHRLAGNGLKKELIAPRWIGKKLDCLNKIDREFLRRNSWQSYKY